jgi:hypothetical protein
MRSRQRREERGGRGASQERRGEEKTKRCHALFSTNVQHLILNSEYREKARKVKMEKSKTYIVQLLNINKK